MLLVVLMRKFLANLFKKEKVMAKHGGKDDEREALVRLAQEQFKQLKEKGLSFPVVTL